MALDRQLPMSQIGFAPVTVPNVFMTPSLRGLPIGQRQADPKGRAPLTGQIGNLSTKALHDLAADRQPQPGTARLVRTDAGKFLEHHRLRLKRNTPAIIREIDHNLPANVMD